ncbi:MAG: hypothetical protein J4G00_03870 [Actinomycetia bacterium]|nr:hypothetical protein [Actinomycetes bacterium]
MPAGVLQPRGFKWIITSRLAVSERLGGLGPAHRKVRRQQEVLWLQKEAGITHVVSLLTNNQNLKAYRDSGFEAHRVPVSPEVEPDERRYLYDKLRDLLSNPDARVLVHGEVIDENLGGLMSGFLVDTGLVPDAVQAVTIIEQILGRPLGARGRALVQHYESGG